MKRVCVLGLGYIGLPTAILAANADYTVFGYDINKEKVAKINHGNPCIVEPGIKEKLVHCLKKKNLKASTQLEYADYFVITVPTPFTHTNNADLSYVASAIEEIGKKLMPGNLVIIESTVPVGSTEKFLTVLEELSGLKAKKDFFLAHCPERAIPGNLFKELKENDRIIGGICQKSCSLAYQFYAKFVTGSLYSTNDKSAEMVKLIENSSRDAQIAFANQVAAMCKQADIDPYHVIELANRHPRVNILNPTCGVGGHCIAIDPWFLVETFPEHSQLLKTAREINNNKPLVVIDQVIKKAGYIQSITKKRVNILGLGLAFKPNVDDIRESPAAHISKTLAKQSKLLHFVSFDPYVPETELPEVPRTQNIEKAIDTADIILILVKHQKFIALAEGSFCNKMVIDTCGLMYDVTKNQAKLKLKGAQYSDCSFESLTI